MKQIFSRTVVALLLTVSTNISLYARETAHNADPHAATNAHHVEGISAESALKEIKEGYSRFLSGRAKHPDEAVAHRRKLASGQKPHTIVLGCSDSRVPPELIFDQGFGDIFTVRVAGNYLNPATVASIEYAVEHLGAKLILVMGHTSCGAVKAAVTTPVGQSAGSRDLDQLISSIRPNLTTRSLASAKPNDNSTFYSYVKANTQAVAEDLYLRSQILHEKIDAKQVLVIPVIYDLEDSHVEFLK